jgi:hypothetical protein
MVVKFLEQLTLVMDALEDSGCYDPTDRFFYDLLTDALGNRERVQVQTLVGVIPALPAMTLPTRNSHQIQRLRKRFTRRMEAQNRQILDWRQQLSLRDIAGDLADRLISIWLPGLDGRRPVYGGVELMQTDPAWKDNLLFYEYFHGDNGAGLGAMHQTGWTALVADLLLDPPRRVRRMVFYDDASIAPDLTDIAAGPAG